MIAFCVESSHARGMGHVFRSCVLADAFLAVGHAVKFYINDHPPALDLLKGRGISFDIVPLEDASQDWESAAVARDGIDVWICDRHLTDIRSTTRMKAANVPLVTFDDRGSGAAAADLHIAALAFDLDEALAGKRVLRGVPYLILGPQIAAYRRPRTTAGRMIVSLGGADTYGVTTKIMRLLSDAGRTATVIIGPAFKHLDDLARATTPAFTIKRNVPSLLEEFAAHDVAVTGGGMTPFEANATGLPCIVVANEDFEVPVGRELQRLGGALFAGHHEQLDESLFTQKLPVQRMSEAALQHIPIDGTRRVMDAVLSL
jgi:spore coat polysaccharide biosynthesis predicted glycosyltransferase SpsG